MADVGDDLGAGDECLAGLVVHDEVKVPLAVTGLLVLEAGLRSRERADLKTDDVTGKPQHPSAFDNDTELSIHGVCQDGMGLDDV